MFRAIEKSAKNPPLSTRNQALIHVAMSDAVVVRPTTGSTSTT